MKCLLFVFEHKKYPVKEYHKEIHQQEKVYSQFYKEIAAANAKVEADIARRKADSDKNIK